MRKPPQREAWKEILFFALLNCLQTVELAIAALERHKVVIFSNNTDTKQVCTPLRGPGDFKELFASGIQTAALVLTLFAELGKCCRGFPVFMKRETAEARMASGVQAGVMQALA